MVTCRRTLKRGLLAANEGVALWFYNRGGPQSITAQLVRESKVCARRNKNAAGVCPRRSIVSAIYCRLAD